MKVAKFMLIILFVLNGPAFADHRLKCNSLRESIKDEKHNAESVACDNIRVCKKIRNHCPQEIDNQVGCEVFKQCLTEYYGAYSGSDICTYDWEGPSDQSMKCKSQNRYTRSCPGFTKILERFRDPTFDCVGHSDKFNEYAEAIDKKIADMKVLNCPEIPEKAFCASLFTKIVKQTPIPEGIANRNVLDNQRNPRPVYDFLQESLKRFNWGSSSSSSRQ